MKIPVGLLEQHIIALGKTGSGKSSKLRVFVEQLLKAGEPVVIIDVKGDWWGLKSSADGKHAGLPLVIFGGKHADLPLNAAAGKELAEVVCTGNRPCIIDVRGLSHRERSGFFIDFASTAYRVNKGKRYLVISEVHNFAFKGKVFSPQAGEMLHWANTLASEGRGLGITLLADSQRGQKVHNDFLTSMETLIACKVIHKSDRDAIKDWIDGCADISVGKAVLESLAQLKKPEAWMWCPEIDYGPERVVFPLFETYDSFKPQQIDMPAKLKGWAAVDLEELKGRLSAMVEEAAANDPLDLKKQIAALQRELADAQVKKLHVEPDVPLIEAAEHRGYEAGFAEGQSEAIRAHGVGFSNGWKACAGAISPRLIELTARNAQFSEHLEAACHALINPPDTVQADRSETFMPAPRPAPPPPARHDPALSKPPVEKISRIGNGVLPKAQSAILSVLAQFPAGRSRSQVAILSGYSAKSSSFDNALGAVRSAGYVNKSGDPIQITAAGRAVANFEPLPKGRALQDYWLGKLGKAERALLSALIKHYPHSYGRDDLAQQAQYSAISSTFDNALGRLRSLELVERGANIRAAKELFA